MKTFAPMKYNPAFLSPSDLMRAFVVRGVDLELITETIGENSGNSNQHVLIIGPRGMGKTMLALRTAVHVTNDQELSRRWFPIVFSEESYEVCTAAEFWLRAVFHLAKQTNNHNLETHHDRLREERDEKRLYERALSCLMDFADKEKKRLLLVVENLNMLLDEQISEEEGWDLRHTLLNEPRIMLLATAVTRFDAVDNSGQAMFDLFRIHQLEPLNTTESKVFWEALTGGEVEERKIRPIQILTGGNPRLMTIISSFAVGASFRELMSQLTSLIDEYTTYFKSNIESLPSKERKVFITLANIWEPTTAARVAREARLDVNTASANLKRLESRGSVAVAKTEGRKKSYQVVERLYNIYHLMRLSGSQSNRVRAVVDFMVNFYEGEELANKMAQLIEEACRLDPEERKDHLAAYSDILHSVTAEAEREKIVQYTSPGFSRLHDVPAGAGMIISDYHPPEEEAPPPPGPLYTDIIDAAIHGARGEWDKALSAVVSFLEDPQTDAQFSGSIISFFTNAAAAGFAQEGLALLRGSACASFVEPLIVALQMMTGESYNAPLEVVEVAKDVVKRIEEKKAE